MLSTLPNAKGDALLSLVDEFRNDTREDKIGLVIGVFKDSNGNTPVFDCVKSAEQRLFNNQTTKEYLGIYGNETFNTRFQANILGENTILNNRSSSIQTPGGSGAIKLIADLLPNSKNIWISSPGYVNYKPIFSQSGLNVFEYPYLDGSQFIDSVKKLGKDDILVLQSSCHNPTGIDLTKSMWEEVTSLCNKNGFIPFIDNAYQGLGSGFHKDIEPVLDLLNSVEYAVMASSASKNFSVYRERTGIATVISPKKRESLNARTFMGEYARAMYSMPPDHGAAVVSEILGDKELKQMWAKELEETRLCLSDIRLKLSQKLEWIDNTGKGMFLMLPLTSEQILKLKTDHSIYLIDNGRINIAGLNNNNLDRFVYAVNSVMS